MERSVDYNTVAGVFDRRYERSEYGPVLKRLLEFAGNTTNRILEVGCGTGHWLQELEKHGYTAAGVDPSPGMLQAAKPKVSSTGLIRGCAEALPCRSETFDRLFCINAFHHFTGKEQFIGESRRVISPDGGILIAGLDPHTGLDRWWIYDYFPQVLDIDKARYPAPGRLCQMLAAAGYKQCHSVEALHWPIEISARTALKSGQLAKTATSQLTVLTDAEYEAGIARLVRDIEAAEIKGKVYNIYADLRMYATIAWL